MPLIGVRAVQRRGDPAVNLGRSMHAPLLCQEPSSEIDTTGGSEGYCGGEEEAEDGCHAMIRITSGKIFGTVDQHRLGEIADHNSLRERKINDCSLPPVPNPLFRCFPTSSISSFA